MDSASRRPRPNRLFEGRDLLATTDCRNVFAAVLEHHFGIPDRGTILPDFEREPDAPDPFATG